MLYNIIWRYDLPALGGRIYIWSFAADKGMLLLLVPTELMFC